MGDLEWDVPRPCCKGHFRLTGGVSGCERRLGRGVERTEDDFTHCGFFENGVGGTGSIGVTVTGHSICLERRTAQPDPGLVKTQTGTNTISAGRSSPIESAHGVYKDESFRPLRQLPLSMKASSSSPPSSSMPHNPPRKPQHPNNLLDPDSLKRFERALAQQYAREYLSRHNPNKSPGQQVFKPRYVPTALFSPLPPYSSVADIALRTPA